MSFVELCLNGEARNCDVDTFIAQWHSGLAGMDVELHEYLGFTWDEYRVWSATPSALEPILDARRSSAAEPLPSN